MRIERFTEKSIERLRRNPPRAGRKDYAIPQVSGMQIRVSAPQPGKGPKMVYRIKTRINGKQVPCPIGSADVLSLAEATKRAKDFLAQASAGINPVAERRQQQAAEKRRVEIAEKKARNTLGALIGRYLAERPTKNKKGLPLAREYLIETERTLDVDVVRTALGKTPLDELTRDAIRTHVRAIARRRPAQGNHAFVYLRTALSWAKEEGLIPDNLAAGLSLPAPRVERDRALADWEIALFWRACDELGYPFGRHAQLLLLTAQRRDELAEATWSEIDLERALWTIPASRTKNARPHAVHLAPLAVELLAGLPRLSRKGYVFSSGMRGGDTPLRSFYPSHRRIAKRMQELAGDRVIEPWVLHDLRRTARTEMARIGVAPHIAERVLNHSVSKLTSSVAKIYDQFEYLPERKSALEALARHIQNLIDPAPSNVVELAAARG
jgi:integrase